MARHTITVPILTRAAGVRATDHDRTVEVIFTTGADVVRADWDTGRRYTERLSVDPRHVRLDRLNAGAPLLNAHSAYTLADQIGVVEPGSARIADNQGTCAVRFSERADVEPIFQDVRDGIIRNVSVGYRVHQFTELSGGKDTTIPVRLATDWEPYEISMVPMGADPGAHVRASSEAFMNACVVVTRATEVGPMTTDSNFMRGAVNWLLTRSNVAPQDADPGEFRGMSLLELARECLTRAGVSVAGLDKMALVSRAFTYRSAAGTSDFAILLETTMHKILQASYAAAPDTWRRFCGVGRVDDFRAHNRYRMGSFAALDAIAENGEFKHKAITDAEKASITAATKGNIIAVTRQAIVNDDLGALAALPKMLGAAAARSIETDVYALLALNGGLGPTQADGEPLFHANRLNVGSTATISAAAIDADAALMARQTDPGGNDYLDLQPAVLLVARELKGTAQGINDAQYDPDTAVALQKPNAVRGLFKDVVGSPRITGTRRYLFADPAIAPVIEVAFLNGQETPTIETKESWNTDGAEMRVRFDYGVAAVDWRGAVTNAG